MHWVSRGAIVAVSALVCVLLMQTSFFSRQSEQFLELLFFLRGERETSQNIIIIGIDEDSISTLGPWPFPRENHARLFDRLREAKVVGFDLIFTADSGNIELFTREGVPAVMAVASSYEGKLLAPDVSANPWIELGHVETELGTDGIVRRVRLMKDGLPSLALAMKGGGRLEADRTELINFYGPEFTFLYLSYSDVLAGAFPPDFFKGRYVLVGARALGLGDVHMIPFSRKHPIPGVEIQATILNNLLDSTFLRVPPATLRYLFSFLLLALCVFLFPRFSVGKNLLVSGAILVLLCFFSFLFFLRNIFFDPFLPGFILFLGYAFHTGIVWMTVTGSILREVSGLNKKLEEGLQTFFQTVPYPLAHTRMDELWRREHFAGLDRYINRLQQGIRALALQNSFVQHLVSAEAPPLVFWAKETGEVVVANARFAALWRSLKLSEALPDLAAFSLLLEKNRIETGKPEREELVSPAAEVGGALVEENVCDILLKATGQRTYLRVVSHEVDDRILGFEGVVASFTDVTEIKELERLKGEVMNIVSHELKLPLTTIMGYGELLADSVTGREREYALEVSSQARRLAEMIGDFLDIARIENGKYAVNHFPFDILDVANDALIVAGTAARQKNIALISGLPTKVSPILGDEALMTQVLINLLDNAIKFSPKETTVRFDLIESETELLVRVTDEGNGVPDEEKEKIFEKFTRGANEKRGTGFGLGLSFVLQVIDSHGGRIRVDDAVGGGAVFQISLPKRG